MYRTFVTPELSMERYSNNLSEYKRMSSNTTVITPFALNKLKPRNRISNFGKNGQVFWPYLHSPDTSDIRKTSMTIAKIRINFQ